MLIESVLKQKFVRTVRETVFPVVESPATTCSRKPLQSLASIASNASNLILDAALNDVKNNHHLQGFGRLCASTSSAQRKKLQILLTGGNMSIIHLAARGGA